MGIKDLFNRKKEEVLVEETHPEAESTSQAPATKVERVRREISIPEYAVEQWSTALFDGDISDAIRAFDWSNPTVEELTLLIRNATNCIRNLKTETLKISFLKYMMSVILNQYCMHNSIAGLSDEKRDPILKKFMMILIQSLADVCTIFGIDFYALFLAIKNVPVYYERKDGMTIEHYFRYSFRYFSKLWENSKSKFLLDNREDHIRIYEDVMCSFFDEFLENAEPDDIDAIYKFSIQNEELIDTDFSELLAEAIVDGLHDKEDGYFEPRVFIGKDVALAISRHYPDLLVASYINRFNSIIYDIQVAKAENMVDEITDIDESLQEIIKIMSDYQEYRSEDFTEYFSSSWEWFLGQIISEFSGISLGLFSDFLINTIKIPQDDVEEYIASSVICLFVYFGNGLEIPLNPYTFAEAYRLLSNEVAFEAIAQMNPSLINSF